MSTPRFVALLGYSGTLVTLLVLAPLRSAPQVAVRIRPSALELAAEVLRTAERFNAAQVGYAGVTPPEALAWRVVVRSQRADSILEDIIGTGTRPGQLYALAGLHLVDSATYKTTLRRFTRLDEPVPAMIGCIVSTIPLPTLLKEIDSGLWTRELMVGRLMH